MGIPFSFYQNQIGFAIFIQKTKKKKKKKNDKNNENSHVFFTLDL